MSQPSSSSDIPPGGDLSISQLLDALRWKLGVKSTDEDILSYESSIRHIACLLRQRSNLLKPINTLPSEILAHIFNFTQRPFTAPSFPPLTQSEQQALRLNAWIRSTAHVCSHWRDVALGTPTLWGSLYMPASPQQEVYGKRFLERAGMAVPLRVHMNLDSWIFDYRTRSVKPSSFMASLCHPERSGQLVELSINGAWHLRESIWSLLLPPLIWPTLESLSLDLSPWNFSSTDVPHILPANLPPLPGLKRLALKDVVAWPYHRFDNLTHLWLGNQDRDFRLDLETFMRDVLGPCREMLEYLALIDAGPEVPNLQHLLHASSSEEEGEERATDFPRLGVLHLDDFEQAGSMGMYLPHVLLSRMRIPANCIVHVSSDAMQTQTHAEPPPLNLPPTTALSNATTTEFSPAATSAANAPVLHYGTALLTPHTTIIRHAPSVRSTHALTFSFGTLHVTSSAPLLLVLKASSLYLRSTRRLVVSTAVMAGASDTRVGEVWAMIRGCAGEVEEVVFQAMEEGESRAGWNWLKITDQLELEQSQSKSDSSRKCTEGTVDETGVGVPILGRNRERVARELNLKRVYLPKMAPSTRLTAAKRALAKEFEEWVEFDIGDVKVIVAQEGRVAVEGDPWVERRAGRVPTP